MRALLGPGLLTLAFAFALTGPIARGQDQPKTPPTDVDDRPNILFIYTDDQARWAVGAYGNKEIHTPNLDRIAREGALFQNAFTVTPVCPPSRASMFTSRYPTQFGIADWIDPKIEPDLGLAPSAITWPKLLKARGYSTGLVGKWHLGDHAQFHPTRQGFNYFYGFLGGGNHSMNPILEVNGVTKTVEGPTADLIVTEGLRFIERNRERPFSLSVHFREPHVPYAPVTEEDSAHYKDLDPTIPDYPDLPRDRVKNITKRYYGSVSSVDRNVGRLLARLDELDLTKKTIVFFTSDHGYMIGHHGLWHKGNGSWIANGKQGRRPNMFDDSIRVPLLVRWPGVVPPGTTIDRTVTNLDMFPTLLDMAGVGVPDNLTIQGRSFAPLLRNPKNPLVAWDDTYFGLYDMHNGATAHMRTIRTPAWKLVRHLEPGVEDELFHLANDPGETKNLNGASEHQAQKAALIEELQRRMTQIQDPKTSELTATAKAEGR